MSSDKSPDSINVEDRTFSGGISVNGARTHNLRDVSFTFPRDAMVVFTGISGSGKSSLAFDTLYAEAQRRFMESVAPHARRLIEQASAPDVDSIDGLPPAVALQQSRASVQERSTVGSLTRISVTLRLLFHEPAPVPLTFRSCRLKPSHPITLRELVQPVRASGWCMKSEPTRLSRTVR